MQYRYHYCAKLRERFGKLGLNSLLKQSACARLMKQELMSLPLLAPEKFIEGYVHIKKISQNFGLTKELRKFFEYFNYWIQEVINFF